MLTLDEGHGLVREAISRLLASRDPIADRNHVRTRGQSYCPELWAECVEMGLPGMLVPPEKGGSGMGVADAVLACEAFGRALAAAPFLSCAVLGGLLVPALGAAGEVALPALLAGTGLFAFADGPGLRLTPHADGWTLDGAIGHVADAGAASLIAVVAEGPDAPMIACVSLPCAGVHVTRRPLIDERDGAAIRFAACVIPHDRAIIATPLREQVRDVARLCAAGEILGLCDAVLAMTLDYARQRRQFGRAIGSFQAVQHQLARLHCDIELLRSTVRAGIEAIGAADFTCAAALAKAKASQSGPALMNACLQLHGGIGMTDDFAIGQYLKRTKVLARAFGDEDDCLRSLIEAATHATPAA